MCLKLIYMGIKSDMNKIPSLLTKALNFQSKMKNVLGSVQELIEPYIDLSDYDGDKEDFYMTFQLLKQQMVLFCN